jgi:cyclophilin family peptidyl-prolyl cis-trans isomerase/HEAT repeat protein
MLARRSVAVGLLTLATLATTVVAAQAPKRRPLAPTDLDAIATLLKIEDTRQFDEVTLTRLLQSAHPEIRRRAAQTIGRVINPRGSALLLAARGDANADVVATVAFAYGQLKDADAVGWLGDEMSGSAVPAVVASEAARSLGKIRSPEARAALVGYLGQAPMTAATSSVVGEALLSLGRFAAPLDLAAVVRWTHSTDAEVRWRATWALYRPRDVAAVPELLRLSRDASGDVRLWACRGLGVPQAPAAPSGRGAAAAPAPPVPPATAPADQLSEAARAQASSRLREALADSDRRVRTEALRALATYDDDASFGAVLAAVDSPDTWISVSATEALARFPAHAAAAIPRLVSASAPGRPTSVRITALAPLTALAPDAAIDLAASLLHDSSLVARTSAVQALRRLGADGRARLDAAVAADPKLSDLVTPAGPRTAPPPAPVRADADYRRIVDQWIVPDYNGAAGPRVVFDTPRGSVEIELYPGEAPFGVEYLLDVIKTGDIVGSEFGRVVPDFVAQERSIRADAPRRDEVNRRGLTRGNLSWASAGLDTGRPGYTLGSTPQPHNEGDFTALGRVVRGMDVVDRIELGDKITGARRK